MKRVDAVAKSNLSLPAKWLAVFMAHHENRKGEVVTNLSAIRSWTGLHRVTIHDAIDELEGSGFLSIITPFKPGPKSSGKFAPTWGVSSLQQPTPDESVAYNNQLVSMDAETPNVNTPRINPSEIPFPLNNPLSIPPVLTSLVSPSFSDGIREQEVTEKDEVVSHAHAQGVMLDEFIEPEWIEVLNELASIKVAPGITGVSAHDQALVHWAKEKGHVITDAIETATYLKSVWPMKDRKSLRATFQNLLHRERQRRQEREANGRNGNRRYRAPGTFVPKGGTPEAYARWPAQNWPA